MSETIYSGDYSRALRGFGLEHLTGESCAIGLRILYDVSEQGIRLIEQAFSLKIDMERTPRNWNSKVGDRSAIASIRLSWFQAKDLLLYGLARKYKYVVSTTVKEGNWKYGINEYLYGTDSKEDLDELLTIIDKSKWYDRRVYCTYDSQPRRGLENVHAFTGRTT